MFNFFSKEDEWKKKASDVASCASIGATLIWDILMDTDSAYELVKIKRDDVNFFITIGGVNFIISKLLSELSGDSKRLNTLDAFIKNSLINFDKNNGLNALMDCQKYVATNRTTKNKEIPLHIASWIVWNLLGRKPNSKSELGFVTDIGNALSPVYSGYWSTNQQKTTKEITKPTIQQDLITDPYDEAVRCYNQKEYGNALVLFKQSAEQGNTNAQCYLGVMYQNGNGVTKDDKLAVFWYQKAADQGNATGQANLDIMYQNGNGVTKDDKLVVFWYQKAADQGNVYGQANLGIMYKNGDGVTKDAKLAVEWFHKSADQGNANAQCNLGVMYKNGNGAIKDDKLAVFWYQKAAAQGSALALSQLQSLGA